MGIDGKYGRVTVENSSIADDEPVVVFRAQDKMLPYVLRMYATLCMAFGSPVHHLDRIRQSCEEVEEWQRSHFTKIPTSDSLAP